MGDFHTTSGAKLYIGGTVTSSVDSLPEFEALSGWTEIGEIEDLGEIGDESTAVTGATIGDGRIRKAKGARDAGTMAVICFHSAIDVGQMEARAAQRTNFNYAFKLEIPDAETEDFSNTLMFFRGLVMSERLRLGTNDNIMRRTFNIAVNSEVYEDVSTTG